MGRGIWRERRTSERSSECLGAVSSSGILSPGDLAKAAILFTSTMISLGLTPVGDGKQPYGSFLLVELRTHLRGKEKNGMGRIEMVVVF